MASELEKNLHELRIKIISDMNITLNQQEERIIVNENIDQKFTYFQKEIEKINQTNEDQEKRIALMEKQIRARNIIFFGIAECEKSYEDLEGKVLSTISDMGVKCTMNELEMVRRMGRFKDGKTRPVNVTFTTYGKKLYILKNKKSLENTKMYVKEDFPPHVLEVRKSLQKQLQKERSEGKRAFLKYDKIIIKGGSFNNKDRNSTQIAPKNQNTKKRELENSPPHTEGNPSTSSQTSTNDRRPKKNKIPRGGQSSMIEYVRRRKATPQTPMTASDIDVDE